MENPFNNILFRHRENIKIIIKIEAIKMFPFLLKIETVFIHLPFHYMFVVSIFTISEIKFKYLKRTGTCSDSDCDGRGSCVALSDCIALDRAGGEENCTPIAT